MPLSIIHLGVIVDQDPFPIAQVEPELQEPVPDPQEEVVTWGWRVSAPCPKKESIRGEKFNSKILGICVANDAAKKPKNWW